MTARSALDDAAGMLVKKAAVGPSSIDGWGLIARVPVERGDVVDESPVIVTAQRVPRAFETHVYRLGDRRTAMPCGDGIFVNHSSRPNAEPRVDSRRRIAVLVALRDISVGEEVTIDYTAPLA